MKRRSQTCNSEVPSKIPSVTIVKLNIGGTIFQTSKSTLTKQNGFFKTLLETEIAIAKDESGAIFVDRSPKHFESILNYLRDGKIYLSGSKEDVKELQTEAKVYLLDRLVELCEEKLNKYSPHLSPESIIKLNVGGTYFQTSKSTLTRSDGFFCALLEPGIPASKISKDESGAIFIDRSPKHFESILNFMRDHHIDLPESSKAVKEIQNEAEYYVMHHLVRFCAFELEKRTEEDKKFNIVIKTLTGQSLPFEVQGSNTVYDLKCLMEDSEGIPPYQQRLIFGDKQLENERSLSDYNVKDGSILHLVLRLRGGHFS